MNNQLIVRPPKLPKVLIYPCDMYAQAGVRRFFWEKVFGFQVQKVTSGNLYSEVYPDEKFLPCLQTVSTGCFYHNLTKDTFRPVRNNLRTGAHKEVYTQAEIVLIVGKKYCSIGTWYGESIQRMRYVFYVPQMDDLVPLIFESAEIDLTNGHFMNYHAGEDCQIGNSIEEIAVYDALCGYYPDFT